MTEPLVVLDTVVLVAAVIGKPESSDAKLVKAVATGTIKLALSDEGLREIVRVLDYPEIKEKLKQPVRAFEVALAIGLMGEFYHPERFDWPSLKDPKDTWLLDLAFASAADYLVSRDKHLMNVANTLGFVALTPPELLMKLRE